MLHVYTKKFFFSNLLCVHTEKLNCKYTSSKPVDTNITLYCKLYLVLLFVNCDVELKTPEFQNCYMLTPCAYLPHFPEDSNYLLVFTGFS